MLMRRAVAIDANLAGNKTAIPAVNHNLLPAAEEVAEGLEDLVR